MARTLGKKRIMEQATSPIPFPSRCAIRIAGLVIAVVLAGGCAIPRWPVQGPLTSAWGLRLRGLLPEIHRGVDISVPDGTPVAAMKAGTVVQAGAFGDYGLTVVIDHGGHTRTLYAHLSHIDVTAGQHVDGRQLIGRSGHTGNAIGPHLHFEIQRWGHSADPVPLLGGRPH